MNGDATNTTLLGPGVHLKVAVKETGRLKGEFVIRMDLEPNAGRTLAESLLTLADQADKLPPGATGWRGDFTGCGGASHTWQTAGAQAIS